MYTQISNIFYLLLILIHFYCVPARHPAERYEGPHSIIDLRITL